MLGMQTPPSASQQLSDSFQRGGMLARRVAGGEASGASLVPTNDLYKTWGPAEPHQFLHPAPLSSR